MIAEPSWDLYRSFLAVLRYGSLSAAARAVGATQPTIGRHIDMLEHRLGLALFTRSQSGLQATDAALTLQAEAEAMEAAAAALNRAASRAGQAQAGTVRVTASEIVGAEILPSILAGLRVRHPGLAIELVLSNRVADLLRRDADIAVRMVRPAQEALIARRIGDVGIGLFAHRDYVARYGLPQSIDDLRNHALIGFDRDDLAFRSVSVSGIPMTRDLFTLRTDSDLAQLAALRAGFGIGGVQIPLAARSGDLIRALPGEIDFTLEIWLAMHEDMRTSLPVRLVFDALAAGLAAYLG